MHAQVWTRQRARPRHISRACSVCFRSYLTPKAALASCSVWLFTAFGRSMGYSSLATSTLWEWTNADPLCLCMLVRNALTLQQRLSRAHMVSTSARLADAAPSANSLLSSLLVPSDLGTSCLSFSGAMFEAFCRRRWCTPCSAFIVSGLRLKRFGSGADAAFASERGEVQHPLAQLVLHRARLATALCETRLVPILLDLEGRLKTQIQKASATGFHHELASFFGQLLNAEAT